MASEWASDWPESRRRLVGPLGQAQSLLGRTSLKLFVVWGWVFSWRRFLLCSPPPPRTPTPTLTPRAQRGHVAIFFSPSALPCRATRSDAGSARNPTARRRTSLQASAMGDSCPSTRSWVPCRMPRDLDNCAPILPHCHGPAAHSAPSVGSSQLRWSAAIGGALSDRRPPWPRTRRRHSGSLPWTRIVRLSRCATLKMHPHASETRLRRSSPA